MAAAWTAWTTSNRPAPTAEAGTLRGCRPLFVPAVREKTHFSLRKVPSLDQKGVAYQRLVHGWPSLPAAEFEAAKRGRQRIGRGIRQHNHRLVILTKYVSI